MTNDIRASIRRKATDIGFDAVGFTSAAATGDDAKALTAMLKQGWHGDMDWLAGVRWSDTNPRGNPQALMPEARSAIVLGCNYGPEIDPLDILQSKDRGAISVYAQPAKDYHDVLKKRLKALARWLIENHDDAEVKVFVDTAPVMEKPLAARAGLGWQGKHTNLVSREFGSWLFLGEILTTLEISPDLPEPDHCGSCDACMRACPTNAFPAPYQLNPSRCISYLTIEHKGIIDPELMQNMGNHVYGCDDCLAVCPWNKFSAPTQDTAFQPRPALAGPTLAELAQLDEAGFREMFKGSPIKRTGLERLLRNVLIAIGNSGDDGLRECAENLANHDSPLVVKTARWALERLASTDGCVNVADDD